jgi:hypothetical protein
LIEALPAEERRHPYRLTGAGSAALANLALSLYPLAFRRRYREEIRALLDDAPPRPFAVLDPLRGAVVAHLRPASGNGSFQLVSVGVSLIVQLLVMVLAAALSATSTRRGWSAVAHN